MSVNHEIYSSTVLDSTLDAAATAARPIELSVVMPCLNERETVGVCVRKAMDALKASDSVKVLEFLPRNQADASR